MVHNRLHVKDFAWLVGWLEGEGSFFYANKAPTLTGTSTDIDIIQRAARLLDGRLYAAKRVEKNWKTVYKVNVCGYPAEAWMRRLLPFLGRRRSRDVRRVLRRWAAKPGKVYRAGGGWKRPKKQMVAQLNVTRSK